MILFHHHNNSMKKCHKGIHKCNSTLLNKYFQSIKMFLIFVGFTKGILGLFHPREQHLKPSYIISTLNIKSIP